MLHVVVCKSNKGLRFRLTPKKSQATQVSLREGETRVEIATFGKEQTPVDQFAQKLIEMDAAMGKEVHHDGSRTNEGVSFHDLMEHCFAAGYKAACRKNGIK